MILNRDLDKMKHKKTQIVSEDRFKAQNIGCRYIPTRILFNQQEKYVLKMSGTKHIKISRLFDGKLFHIQNLKLQDSKIIFSMCVSSFKEYVGTCSNEFKRLFGQDNIVRPLSVGTMIITTDNKWIIGRRLETHDYQGSYTLVAGYMDPDKDVIDFKPDPLFAMKRELKEETGIEETCLSDITCLGLDGED